MKLVMQSGSQPGYSFELIKDRMTLGRGSNADVQLADLTASRVHAQISREPAGYFLQDLGSANGTFVNNERVTSPRLLHPGDVIGIGQTQLVVEESAATIASEPILSPPPIADAVPVPGRGASRGTYFALIGGVLAGLVLIGVVFIAAGGFGAPPTPTAVALSTMTAPAASAVSAATLAATTAAPQVVPSTVAPTRAPAPATSVPATISGACIECTVTPTNTPTNTPVPPTLTPTATPTRSYLEPSIKRPADGAKFGQFQQIVLSWDSVGSLRPLDMYHIQVARDANFQQLACEIYSTETIATIPGNETVCNANWQFNQIYFWRIQVVVHYSTGKDVLVSPQGQIHQFGWQP